MYKVSFYIKLNCLVLCPNWLWQMTINGLLCFRKLENANQCSYFNTYIQLFSQLYEYQLDHLEKLDFSLSFCSTIVFIQLSSSISQVHLHRHVQNTVTSHCGTVYCITANLVMSIFSLFLLTHWHITIFYCALSSLVSVNIEILVTGFHVLWLQC